MPSLSPRSMPALVVTGLLIVTLPLASAVFIGIIYVDRLLQQTELLVAQGVEVTRHSRLLQEQVHAMERSARQYTILGDPALIELYEKHQKAFYENLDLLESIELKGVSEWNLGQMRQDSQQILDSIRNIPAEADEIELALDNFTRMSELADGLEIQGNEFIDSELDRLRDTTSKARTYLSWSVIALLPGVAVLIVIFTFILSRPLQRLSKSIRDLGEGKFNSHIVIKGPPVELEALGDQLEWLRVQLKSINEESDSFLRHMSHELKTPLASIRESTELLNDGTLGELSGRQREVVGLLRENGQKLEFLIENLLYMNAGSDNSRASNFEKYDLAELVRAIVSQYQLLIGSKSLKVLIHCPKIHIYGDRLKMRMALNNLFSNAIKFSPQGGQIRILCVSNKKLISINVLDNGPGIPENERKLVFQPFYQGSQSHDSHLRGSGIGLSVVQDCVKAHDGKVSVIEARSGAHFRIEIPVTMPVQGETYA